MAGRHHRASSAVQDQQQPNTYSHSCFALQDVRSWLEGIIERSKERAGVHGHLVQVLPGLSGGVPAAGWDPERTPQGAGCWSMQAGNGSGCLCCCVSMPRIAAHCRRMRCPRTPTKCGCPSLWPTSALASRGRAVVAGSAHASIALPACGLQGRWGAHRTACCPESIADQPALDNPCSESLSLLTSRCNLRRQSKLELPDGRHRIEWFLIDDADDEHLAIVGEEKETRDGHYLYRTHGVFDATLPLQVRLRLLAG